MAEQIVTVEVDKNGDFTVDMVGFKGKGCKAVADAFSAAGKVIHEDTKPEYYQEGPGGNQSYISSGR